MSSDDQRQRYADDALILARIGAHLFPQPTTMTVQLPRELADAAVRSWQQDEIDQGTVESPTLRQMRGQAGTLALIGLAIEQRSRDADGDVAVELDAWFIGSALDAADEAGLLSRREAER